MAGYNKYLEKLNMKILIVEDEPPIAREVARLTRTLLGDKATIVEIVHSIDSAFQYLEKNAIDLCLLDLQLSNQNGYNILKNTVAGSFHTIIISAHTEQAQEAFEYGVLDFVPKPINKDRLKIAFDRFLGIKKTEDNKVKFLVVRKHQSNFIISVSDVLYFRATGYLVEIHLKSGKIEIYDKPLNRLEQILPDNFIRTHRSYIVDINQIQNYRHKGNSVYEVELKNNEVLPLSNGQYKLFKCKLTVKTS